MKDKNAMHRKILRLVLPIAFQQFMLALVGACDALMLGKLHQNICTLRLCISGIIVGSALLSRSARAYPSEKTQS